MTRNTGPKDSTVYESSFHGTYDGLERLLDSAGLADLIKDHQTILIKPNLVESLPPPITTPVELVGALVVYLQKNSDARVVVGEGTGSQEYDTWKPFHDLGYAEMAARYGIELIDLNEAPLERFSRHDCHRWPEMYLPEIVSSGFLLSVPVLKAHSLADVTLTMKNMMGVVPPSHYGRGTSWKKARFHERIHEAIADLNRYRTPDFTLLDATVGMAEAHLWGPVCDPPVDILAASADPVAIDAYGCRLLGKKWQNIGHIRQVHNELGFAEPLRVQVV